MPIRIVRLGSPRHPREGLRVGTVRRPPRGVRKDRYARENFYDVWLPALATTETLLQEARASIGDGRAWPRFVRRYTAEMSRPDASRLLDLLAALSHQTSLSVGCYCDDEARCHRSVLRGLLRARGADIV